MGSHCMERWPFAWQVVGAHSIEEMVKTLKKPRRIMMLVMAGKPVDDFIELLIPHLEPGDIIIDGGNSHFPDSEVSNACSHTFSPSVCCQPHDRFSLFLSLIIGGVNGRVPNCAVQLFAAFYPVSSQSVPSLGQIHSLLQASFACPRVGTRVRSILCPYH